MGAILDWMDRFATGLQAGGGRMAGAGNSWAGARAKAKEQEEQEAFRHAFQNVDDWNSVVQQIGQANPQKGLELALAERKMQQELERKNAEKQYDTTNERKNVEYLMSLGLPQEKAINMAYKQNQSSALSPYDKKTQELQAKKEYEKQQEIEKKEIGYQKSNELLSDTINFISELDESLVGPYSGILQSVGAFTGGNIGFTNEQQMLKGELERRIGEIENEVISNARSAGQVGVNTIQEIKQAAKGIATAKSKHALLGALKHMQELNNKYIELGRNQLGIKNQAEEQEQVAEEQEQVAEEQEQVAEEQEQIVDYKTYFGG